MKVSKLIKKLKKQLEEYGDLDVRIEADHGHAAMSPTWVGFSYIDDNDAYIAESIELDDDELCVGQYPQVVLIQGY